MQEKLGHNFPELKRKYLLWLWFFFANEFDDFLDLKITDQSFTLVADTCSYEHTHNKSSYTQRVIRSMQHCVPMLLAPRVD